MLSRDEGNPEDTLSVGKLELQHVLTAKISGRCQRSRVVMH